jgi:hypothetical protein
MHLTAGMNTKRHPEPKPKVTPTLSEPEELNEIDLDERQDEEQMAGDVNFRSELEYDGYRTIEEYDNGAYGGRDLERNEEPPGRLKIRDRKEPSSLGEESLIDPQENRKG